MLIAGAEMDVQSLNRVVVVHVQGDLNVHAPQLVHQGDKALQVHMDVVVHRHPEGLLDLIHEHIGSAVVVGVVELGRLGGPGAVHRRVPGNGDHADLSLGRVKAHQDDGVGVAAVHILAQKDEVIDPVPAHQGVRVLRVRHGEGRIFRVRGRRLRLGDGGRLHQQLVGDIKPHHNGGTDHQKYVQLEQDAVAALRPAPGRGLLHPPSAGGASAGAAAGAGLLSCAGIDQGRLSPLQK